MIDNPPISVAASLFSLCLAFALLGLSVFGLRRRLFSEGYSVLWFLVCLGLVAIPVLGRPLYQLAQQLGFYSLSSFLFLVGVLGLFGLIMVLSMHVSKLRRDIRRLAQEVAIRDGVRRSGDGGGPPPVEPEIALQR